MQKSIKLSKYASLMGIHYQTALNHFHAGLIVGAYQDGKTTSFCCRLYGLRRAKNKMERLEKILKENNEE